MNSSNTKEIILSVFSVALKVVVIVIAAMFIYKYAAMGYDYGYRIFGEKPVSSGEGRDVSVTVGPDMSVREIGQLLENKGLIRDANLFFIQERLSEHHGKIEPGEYTLSTAMTVEQMITAMASDTAESEEDTDTGNDVLPTTEDDLFMEGDSITDDIIPNSGEDMELSEDEDSSVGEVSE